jgi:hypothetical protein
LLAWLRELAATVSTFDRSALEPGYALRCTIGVAIPLVVAAMLGQPALGVAAAIGAFITGFTSLQGVYRTRLSAVLVAALGMSATSFVGALAAHSTPAIIAVTELETRPRVGAALKPFEAALGATMAELADAVRDARRARLDDGVATASSRLESELDASEPAQRFILESVRAYVEASARLARLVGVEKAKA